MAVPARPVGGNVVDSAWGQIVHDQVVALDIQSGVGAMVFANSAVGTSTQITFPRPFAAIPVVLVVMGGTTGAGVNLNVGVGGITTAVFSAQGREVRETPINSTMPFQWIAIGPRA